MAFRVFVGEPGKQEVCHSCDNPACWNPAHLFTGSHQDNMADMRRKGRSLTGEKNTHAVLRESDVRTIRKSQERNRGLARTYGVSEQTICDIRKRRTWAHVT